MEKDNRIQRNDTLFAGPDATLEFISGELGEITTVHVPPGRHRASYFFDLAPEGGYIRPGKSVTCFPPRLGVTIVTHPGFYQSDANPDFQPLSATEKLVQEMRQQVDILRRNNQSAAARARGAASIETIPRRDPDAVVEPITAPPVKPAASPAPAPASAV